MRFRYSRWDGTQDPFGPDVPAADVLEELSDDILMGAGADHALQRLLRGGMQGRFSGIDALRRRLRQQREREEQLLDLTGPLEDIRERLEEILERERAELSFRDDDDARAREAFLDAMPPDAPGQIGELREYRFIDPTAQRLFHELQEHIHEEWREGHIGNITFARGLSLLKADADARPRVRERVVINRLQPVSP